MLPFKFEMGQTVFFIFNYEKKEIISGQIRTRNYNEYLTTTGYLCKEVSYGIVNDDDDYYILENEIYSSEIEARLQFMKG